MKENLQQILDLLNELEIKGNKNAIIFVRILEKIQQTANDFDEYEKELLNKELENKIVDYEASKGEEIRAKKGISEEEALSKIKQQVQKIRNTFSEKIEEIEAKKIELEEVQSQRSETMRSVTSFLQSYFTRNN